MARSDRGAVANKGRVKLRVIEFELDGSDVTLQESIRGILSAIGTRAPATRINPALTGKSNPDVGAEVLDEEAVEEEEANSGSTNDDAEPREKKQRFFKSPQIVNDLDLVGGVVSLKAYCDDKKPTTEARRYLVIAAWLKEYRNITDVSADHIYTCFRHMGWHPSKDVSAPFRAMKAKNGWFGSGQARGTYTINHVGLAQIDKAQ